MATALLVVLLIASVAAVGLYTQVGTLLGANVEQSMTAAASAEADELTEWTRQNRLVTQVIAEDSVYEDGNRTSIRGYLQIQRESQQEADIVNAYVVDRQNLTVEVSARQDLEGVSVANLPWSERFAFRDFDDVRITRPHETRNKTAVIGFITPIQQKPGHLLVVTVETASVFRRFNHPVDGGFARVVNSNGTVVFADSRSAMLRQYHDGPLRAPIVSIALRGESGFSDQLRYEQSASVRGDYVAAFAPVDGTDWVLIEHASASNAYAIIRQVRIWIGVAGVLSLIGLLGVVAVIGADTTGALFRLSQRAEHIADGEYDVAFEMDRPDEFGDLNRTLAMTRDTLRNRIEEIRETNEALEASNATLEERTIMVSVLNRILRHNVRNEVNVIVGHAEYLAHHVDDESLEAKLDSIKRVALELGAVSDQAHHVTHLISGESAEVARLQFPDCLEIPLKRSRAASPAATITLTVDDPPLEATGLSTFPVALADVVDNIIENSDEEVTVSIEIGQEATDGGVVVSITDDGAGLPEMDTEAIVNGEETPLKHAQGLALWCLEWTVSKVGGTLSVNTDDATVKIHLPPEVENPRATDQFSSAE